MATREPALRDRLHRPAGGFPKDERLMDELPRTGKLSRKTLRGQLVTANT
ncbi:hypothetical protein [Immundisolibacter sp.]|nr:hypothetical protein [Immundisolibacter sp.]MDD3651669.1 hypothetical protein [Immundisolibacter sp.]